MKLKLKPPGTKRLKLKCDTLLSTSAFKSNLRRYTKDAEGNPLPKESIWGDVNDIMAAGHRTTASNLTVNLHHLARLPDVRPHHPPMVLPTSSTT